MTMQERNDIISAQNHALLMTKGLQLAKASGDGLHAFTPDLINGGWYAVDTTDGIESSEMWQYATIVARDGVILKQPRFNAPMSDSDYQAALGIAAPVLPTETPCYEIEIEQVDTDAFNWFIYEGSERLDEGQEDDREWAMKSAQRARQALIAEFKAAQVVEVAPVIEPVTPTDTAPVTEQPAPTFDDLRAATDAASAAELAAHNALVQAENAYCYAAGLDGDDRREWTKVAARFGRTKAGQQLHAALTEARQVLREAVRVDTEACRKTWVNGFGTLNAPAEQPAPVDPSSLALDPIDYDWSNGYQDAINGKQYELGKSDAYQDGYTAGKRETDELTIEQEERRRIVEDTLAPDCDDCAVDNSRDGYMEAISELSFNLDAARDEITCLNRIIEGLQADLHACERKVKAAQDAADNAATAALAEIEQLRGDLFAERNAHAETTKALREILGGDPVAEVKYDADYSMPWVCIVRKMEQSAKFYCSSREHAEQQATQTAAALRQKNKWNAR